MAKMHYDPACPERMLAHARIFQVCAWVLAGATVVQVIPAVRMLLAGSDLSPSASLLCLFAPLNLLNVHVLFQRSRILTRAGDNRCLVCGYDQSHSPQRCPECGLSRERWGEYLNGRRVPRLLTVGFLCCMFLALGLLLCIKLLIGLVGAICASLLCAGALLATFGFYFEVRRRAGLR